MLCLAFFIGAHWFCCHRPASLLRVLRRRALANQIFVAIFVDQIRIFISFQWLLMLQLLMLQLRSFWLCRLLSIQLARLGLIRSLINNLRWAFECLTSVLFLELLFLFEFVPENINLLLKSDLVFPQLFQLLKHIWTFSLSFSTAFSSALSILELPIVFPGHQFSQLQDLSFRYALNVDHKTADVHNIAIRLAVVIAIVVVGNFGVLLLARAWIFIIIFFFITTRQSIVSLLLSLGGLFLFWKAIGCCPRHIGWLGALGSVRVS